MPELHVIASGAMSLIQDHGRPGWASIGVGRSGAADLAALRRGAAMVGNREGDAAIEVLLGGLSLRVVESPVTMALTGARMPVKVDGQPVSSATAFEVRDGAEIRIGSATAGLRGYLSVRGGIAVTPVLGSRSRDTLAEIGPPPLRPGDRLPVGEPQPIAWRIDGTATDEPASAMVSDRASHGASHRAWDNAALPPIERTEPITLTVLRGPRDDWFADPDALVRTTWAMSPDSDRVGLRLTGDPLRRNAEHVETELPSEGLVRGAVQVPPSGEPLLMGPDHPVTGGYPVIGVLTERATDQAAQLRPGRPVRFEWVGD